KGKPLLHPHPSAHQGCDPGAHGRHPGGARAAQPDGALKTIVFLHGLASNGSRWWDFAARTQLTDWRILRPSLRGASGTGDRRPVGMQQWSDDLARLLDAEGAPRAVVAGHCLGANIALNFAARYPQRTAALVLIEPMPPRALTGKLGFLRHFRFIPITLSWLLRGINALGIYRRRIEPMDLEAWDKAVRAGTADLATYASPFSDLRFTPLAAYFRALAAVGDPLPEPRRAAPRLPRGATEGIQGRPAQAGGRREPDGDDGRDRDSALRRRHRQPRRLLRRAAGSEPVGAEVAVAAECGEDPRRFPGRLQDELRQVPHHQLPGDPPGPLLLREQSGGRCRQGRKAAAGRLVSLRRG